MAKRNIIFKKGEFYHIFNQGTDHRDIFLDKEDFIYFLKRLIDLNQENTSNQSRTARSRDKSLVIKQKGSSENLVDIVAYSILPNHFHLLIRAREPQNLSKFMHKLSTSYVKYFNSKNKRKGSLFQGKFLAQHIMNKKHLIQTSIYINLNHVYHNITENVCSSIDNYLFDDIRSICSENEVSHIKKSVLPAKYLDFAENISEQLFKDKEMVAIMENL